MRFRIATVMLSLAAGSAAQSQTVSLNGSMGARQALLVIDGQPRVVSVGATSMGVRLLSLSATHAEIEVAGQRRLLAVGSHPGRVNGIEPPSGGNEIVLAAGSGGHFMSDGQINGKPVNFLVDTGATTIAMGQSDADRLGINYKDAPRGFASTANGRIPINTVMLSSVRLGDVQIANVEAVVMPLALPHVLLGNSFLTRFQMKRDNDTLRLVKRP